MADTRYVYGFCTWNGPVQAAGTSKTAVERNGEVREISLPCCPNCGSMLMEYASEEDWLKGAAAYDKDHPGYLDLMAWGKLKCFPMMNDLVDAYREQGGVYVG